MARQTPGPILLTPTHIQAIMIACVFVGLQLQQPAKQLAYSSDQFRRNRYIDTRTRDGPGGRDRMLATRVDKKQSCILTYLRKK